MIYRKEIWFGRILKIFKWVLEDSNIIKNKFLITASGVDADVDAGIDDTVTTAAGKYLTPLFNGFNGLLKNGKEL
ncbi:hypothetical protein C1646_771015 [Rhizophagus diaphanus]|nr:hypothetical protein C1646_771015 [Rhizophagus diaphanus] [Rhizophagus sp. MUCL 43196]